MPTLNVTEGCCLGCTYYYIQGYTHYPGSDTIVLFANTAEVLREELARKRKHPQRVYFSPSSDAFQYLPEVQEVTFQAMAVVLENAVEVSFLTKGFVSRRPTSTSRLGMATRNGSSQSRTTASASRRNSKHKCSSLADEGEDFLRIDICAAMTLEQAGVPVAQCQEVVGRPAPGGRHAEFATHRVHSRSDQGATTL